MVVQIQVQVYEQDQDSSPDLSLCPLIWRPTGQTWLEDEDVSEFVPGAAENHTVTRLTIQELKEVFDLPTPLKTQKKTCHGTTGRHVTVRPDLSFTKIRPELEVVRHLVS